MRILENCEPERVFYYFEEICKIPHGSGNTKQISDYLVQFAKDHDLEWYQDDLNNVMIRKKAAPGYEHAPTVILQGHMDMVCEKRPDVEHDFTRDGLKLCVKDGKITASGTTLGGDDGIAVAYSLAILEDEELLHPELEVVLTVDEETGLLGAADFDCSVLKGRTMINLDSEAEGYLWVSCAGGLNGEVTFPVHRLEAEGEKLVLKVGNLTGGHSGAEIDKNRGNANVLMGRILHGLSETAYYEIISVDGGSKHNAIPRECEAVLLAPKEDLPLIHAFAEKIQTELREEYLGSDEQLTVEVLELGTCCAQIMHPSCREKLLFFLTQVPCGVQKMSGTVKNLVETSVNPGIVKTSEAEIYCCTSIRSSLNAAKAAVSKKIEYLAEFLGGTYLIGSIYPAWEYRSESPLREKVIRVHEELFGKKPEVVAIHAGLECGLFYEKMEGLDCVSLGPDLQDIHTSEESMDIASVERVYRLILKVLESFS